jgi:hypothetical protein
MKKIILLLVLFVMISQPAFAHILQTDGSIGAVLHTDPDDDPIIGKPTGFFFELKDKQGKFKLENCDCTFSISTNGKEIFSQPLSKDASSFFTFSKKGLYQIQLTGKPNTANLFQSFTVQYNLRVEKGMDTKKTPSSPMYLIGLIALLVSIVIVGFRRKNS